MCLTASVKRLTLKLCIAQTCYFWVRGHILIQVPLDQKFFKCLFLFTFCHGYQIQQDGDPSAWDCFFTARCRCRPSQLGCCPRPTEVYTFTQPPSSYTSQHGQVLEPNCRPHQICSHLLHNRPCPSLLDPQIQCHALHPEFLSRDGHYTWPPRTWICHAYQRRSDKSFGQDTCHQHQCPLLHRPGSSNTRSRMVFRLDLRSWHRWPNPIRQDGPCRHVAVPPVPTFRHHPRPCPIWLESLSPCTSDLCRRTRFPGPADCTELLWHRSSMGESAVLRGKFQY